MALAAGVQILHGHFGSHAEECQGRASLPGTRNPTTSRSMDIRGGKGWRKGPDSLLKLKVSTVGLSVKETQVARFPSRRKGRAYALQEKHSILSALTSTFDSSLSLSSSEDSNSIPAGEIELNYTTVKEIVENLQDAPFLQYVYCASHGGKSSRQRLSEEFFQKPDTWGPVRKCLVDAAPDGIIMVHRLDKNNPSECCLIEKSSEKIGMKVARSEQDGSGSVEDYWGLLVHGCRVRCNACYLLRTTRQASPNGFTTYFMLIRAECFGPSMENQFKRASLL